MINKDKDIRKTRNEKKVPVKVGRIMLTREKGLNREDHNF
jgi:hypothetical protein